MGNLKYKPVDIDELIEQQKSGMIPEQAFYTRNEIKTSTHDGPLSTPHTGGLKHHSGGESAVETTTL